MGKKKCILHANCQGEPLQQLLSLSKGFSHFWEITHYTNYTKQPIPAEQLAECDLFIYQYLGEHWDDFASKKLCSQLPAKCKTICIPNMFFKAYWPFWTSESQMDYGDSLLDRLVASGAEKPEILSIYLHRDLKKFVDLDNVFRKTMQQEKEKEKLNNIKTTHLVEEWWQQEQLFYSVNHPGKRLLIHLANSVLELLGLQKIPFKTTEAFTPEYAEFELPIHPQVSSFYNLSFIQGLGHEFNVYGRKMNFSRYVSRYIDCLKNGFNDNFIGYLQLV